MGVSNVGNGGSQLDAQLQLVSADGGQYTYRAAIYLTSLNVHDTTNNFAVSGDGNWNRSGTYGLGGVYSATLIYASDTSFGRGGADYAVGYSTSFSSVEYWGTTLSASASAVVPNNVPSVTVPDPPNAFVDQITATSAHGYGSWNGTGGSMIDQVIYHLIRSRDGVPVSSVYAGWDGWTWGGLEPATQYSVSNQAHNAQGWSQWSQPAYFTTLAAVPSALTIGIAWLEPTRAGIYTTAAPASENGAPVDSVLYRVYRVSDGAFMGEMSAGYSGVAFAGLTRATQYDAYGFAHNAVGYGPQSAGVRFTTSPTIPSAPTITSITAITPTSAVVSWAPPSDNGGQTVTSYGVQYALDAAFTVGVSAVLPTGTLTGLTPGVQYFVRVRAGNATGVGPWSSNWYFTTLTGMKVYNGTAWVDSPVYAWNGSAWVACEVRIWNGSAWVPTG